MEHFFHNLDCMGNAAKAKLCLGLLLAVVTLSLLSCSASLEIVGNTVPEDTSRLMAELPKDPNTRNSMMKLVNDKDLMKVMIEFQNEVNAKIRSANPSGLNTEKLRDAYKHKDIVAATAILGLAQPDLQALQQKLASLHSRIQIVYPEVYDYAKNQFASNRNGKVNDCTVCDAETALGNMYKTSNAVQASYILQSKKFKGYPELVYPQISFIEDSGGGGGGGGGGTGGSNDCPMEQVVLAALRCQLVMIGCSIGAAFTPPPFNFVLLAICFVDWNFCAQNALQCK